MAEASFVYIADVFCPWCYGFGPIMKRLTDEHPEFPITVIGGNLMSHPIDLQEYARQDPGLAEFWKQVQATTGRNLGGALAALENGKRIRMYSPGADLILMALREKAPGQELEQMLLLEDMFYGQGEDLFSDAAVDQIARRWNVDAQALMDSVNTPANEEATEKALEKAAELMGEITAYPSVLLVRGQKVEAVSRGYVHYETVAKRLEDAMQDLGVDAGPGEYCSWHGNCAFGARRK